jgi:DNA segregation ATPase FtsK/SpoIIIE, S-DNA-T family
LYLLVKLHIILDLKTPMKEEAFDDIFSLYEQAKEEVQRAGKASASLLQRRLRVGYSRAARLIDLLEQKGVVGPADGAKPREVYGATPDPLN